MQPESFTDTRSSTGSTPARDGHADDVADALQAVGTMTTWVTHADTKAGLLAAAAAVIIAAIAQDRHMIADVVQAAGAAEIISAAILIGIGIALVIAVVALGAAVTPRTRLYGKPSRFGLPTLAGERWTRTPAPRNEVSDEAWAQAATLARIADGKFLFIRIASVAVTVALLLLGAWVLATSFVT